jgi:hypothetical protein
MIVCHILINWLARLTAVWIRGLSPREGRRSSCHRRQPVGLWFLEREKPPTGATPFSRSSDPVGVCLSPPSGAF